MENIFRRKIFLLLGLSLASPGRAERCHELSVFITLNKGERCTSRQGHVGIGIDDEFYDWGPAGKKSDLLMELFGEKGSPFDDKLIGGTRGGAMATSREVRDFLRGETWKVRPEGVFYNTCETYEVRASVRSDQKQALVYYWNYIYEKQPYFHVLKSQCTNIAFASLRYSGILERGRVLLKPRSFLERLEAELKSSCGPRAGQAAQKIRLR